MTVHGLPELKGNARYDIRRWIGEGGMGVVYEALDRVRDLPVALKTLARVDARSIYRLKREFRSLADVTHPNLVTLHELVSADGEWFFTMELVDGVGLLEWVRGGESAGAETITSPPASEGAPPLGDTQAVSSSGARALDRGPWLDVDRLRAALRQLALGIVALHEAGKLHRDVKPNNVMVGRDGRLVLLDFGLVREHGEVESDERRAAEDEVVGTPAYMSPEQAAGEGVGPASDWYGVGAVLYDALTGRPPFVGGLLELLLDKQERDPPPPSSLVPGVPEDLDRLCMELLRRRPEERPSGREILARLGVADPEAASAGAGLPTRAHVFVGREEPFRALADAFDATLEGRPVAIWVRGRSGLGKTALVRHFLDWVRERHRAVILAGRCYEHESVPYKAIDDLVDALTRYLLALPRADAAALLPRHVGALARVFPVLAQVEAVAAAPVRAEPPDARELRARAFGALKELLARIADRRPLVVHVDDLQWGDADSAALLEELLRPPEAPTLLLIASLRDEAGAGAALPAALPADGAEVRALTLGPLPEADAQRLALALLGREDGAAQRLAEAIAREADGSPFFVGELVQHAAAAGGATGVTLEELVLARVARLAPAARRLLEVIAVAGRPLGRDVAVRAAALEGADVAALAEVRGAHLVRARGGGATAELETHHDRVRETVVAQLAAGALRDCHRRLAEALEAGGRADPESLALHLEGAGERARAGVWAATAGDRAAKAVAFDRAARLYRRALALSPPGAAARRGLHERLGDALANAGRGAEAARAFLDAVDGAPAARGLELRRRAAEQLLGSGHRDQGLAVVRGVLAEVGLRLPATPRRALAVLLWRRARLAVRGLDFEPRDEHEVDPAALVRADVCWSLALGLGAYDLIGAGAFQSLYVLLALRTGERYRVARALAGEAALASTAGRRARARVDRLLARAHALAAEVEHPYPRAQVTGSAGIAEAGLGRFRAAVALCEESERLFRDRCTGVAWEIGTVQRSLLASLVYAGEILDAHRRADLQRDEAAGRGDLYGATNNGAFAAVLRLRVDDVDGARRGMAEVMAPFRASGAFLFQHYMELFVEASIDLYAGDGAGALEQLQRRWRGFRRSFIPYVQLLRLESLQLRARCAVAAAAAVAPAERAPLLRAAERDARRVERERMEWATPLATLVRAGVAALRADEAGAAALLDHAARGLDAADLVLHAAAARRRRADLIGGDEGAAARAAADAVFRRQGVAAPDRLVAMMVPGVKGGA